MEGVLKSWAVPKGPSLDPADKRLAMQVEDHPVSYFHFEGIIPPNNYGAGTVMVWDTGTWEPLKEDYSDHGESRAEREKQAAAMLAKGDLKFRLHGQKLKGDFVLAKMRSKRPGSKGTEWLLMKKRGDDTVVGYDIDKYDYSALTNRSLDEIAADAGAAEWQSNRPAAAGSSGGKNAWLAESVAKHDRKASAERVAAKKSAAKSASRTSEAKQPPVLKAASGKTSSAAGKKKDEFALASLKGAVKAPMPSQIHPMLATLVDSAFDDNEWLYEIKWDGYRSVLFFGEDGKRSLRMVSRNQNDQTDDFPELHVIAERLNCRSCILDGEIVAMDESGRASFSLMQQRSGLSLDGKRRSPDHSVFILYYAFDLLFLDGYSLMKVDLEERKKLLAKVVQASELLKVSEHFVGNGKALLEAARQQELEGIVAKRRTSCYIQKRSREWLKIKITQRQECVIGGYTDPRGGRENFGSLVLGLYDDKGRLIPVGQAGSGFTHASHAKMWEKLHKLETKQNPFAGRVDSPRKVHFVKPELVAEIKFTEWTHETGEGGVKMRAPVFQGLRADKAPRECTFEATHSTREEVQKAEGGDAA
jgi:bifunctional non-homologous end joining protein LigD